MKKELYMSIIALSATIGASIPLIIKNKNQDNEIAELKEEINKPVKDKFVEWLSLQNLASDPYEIITVEYTKTDATTFNYEYYTATVYYTVGDMKQKKFIFAYDTEKRVIVQVAEIENE